MYVTRAQRERLTELCAEVYTRAVQDAWGVIKNVPRPTLWRKILERGMLEPVENFDRKKPQTVRQYLSPDELIMVLEDRKRQLDEMVKAQEEARKKAQEAKA